VYRRYLELVELRENAMAARTRATRARRLAARSPRNSAAAFERQSAALEERAATLEDQARNLEVDLNTEPREEPRLGRPADWRYRERGAEWRALLLIVYFLICSQ